MTKVRSKVRVPKSASVGDEIKIKTIIAHPMESGLRKTKKGEVIPLNIINKFEAKFNGSPFFSVTMHPGVSADPYFAFNFKVPGPGEFSFHWTDDRGESWVVKRSLAIA